MEFQGIRQIQLSTLGLSQIYLSAEKMEAVEKWFDPRRMDDFLPLPVHDFGDGRYTLTDGHTRAFVAYKNGLTTIPVLYDRDDMVTNPLGQTLYQADIEWCRRFKLYWIGDLEDRIVGKSLYQKLWVERCDRSHNLLTQTSEPQRVQFQNRVPELFLYGACEDLSVLYFENESGELFVYQDNTLTPEK